MNRQRNEYLTDVAKEIVDDLLLDTQDWSDVGEGMCGPIPTFDWNEMVCIVRSTLIDRMGEVECSG